MKKHIMILAALLIANPAKAGEVVKDNGNELLELCNSSNQYERGMCLGYIRGLSVGVETMLSFQNKKICYPAGVTVGQMQDVVVSYIERNPAKRHEISILLFMRAINEAWPCQ